MTKDFYIALIIINILTIKLLKIIKKIIIKKPEKKTLTTYLGLFLNLISIITKQKVSIIDIDKLLLSQFVRILGMELFLRVKKNIMTNNKNS